VKLGAFAGETAGTCEKKEKCRILAKAMFLVPLFAYKLATRPTSCFRGLSTEVLASVSLTPKCEVQDLKRETSTANDKRRISQRRFENTPQRKEYKKLYSLKHKEKIREQVRALYMRNKLNRSIYKKKYERDNKEKIRAYQKLYEQSERRRRYKREYYLKNRVKSEGMPTKQKEEEGKGGEECKGAKENKTPTEHKESRGERRREYKRQYYLANKQKVLSYAREYHQLNSDRRKELWKKKQGTSPSFYFLSSLRRKT
jgi:hypothetical protein